MLRNLNTLHYSPPLYEYEKDIELFMDSVRFFNFVEYNAVHVDVITFTLGRNPLTRLRRVVANIVTDAKSTEYVDQLRINTNVHSKIFYMFGVDGKIMHIFTGSLNLNLGLNYNVMLQVHKRLHKNLLAYFEAVWKNSKPFPKVGNADNVSVNNKNKKQK